MWLRDRVFGGRARLVPVVAAALALLPSCALFRMVDSEGSSSATPFLRPAHHSTLSFEIREVLATSGGAHGALAATPFTTGVIAPRDPFRKDPRFSEAPPDAAGDLVTFTDSNGDGFFSPNEPKWRLGPAAVTADEVRSALAVQLPPGNWSVNLRLDRAGSDALRSLTRRTLGMKDAQVVDRHVVAAPTVQGVVPGGLVQVTGLSRSAAHRLAAELNGSA
jgi:hypothetical protein